MRPRSVRARGLSLIELMVALAIGMALVAAGLLFTAHQLRDTGRLQREQRLVQDLRSAADMIARDLRRSRHWDDAQAGVWPGAGTGLRRNPHALSFAEGKVGNPADTGTGPPASSDGVDFSYSTGGEHGSAPAPNPPDAVATHERFGYRLKDGVIQVHLGGAGWQALTDAGTLKVTSLQITPHLQSIPFNAACARACPPASAPGTEACPPRQELVHVDVGIVASAVSDPRLVSRVNVRARLRNDTLHGACPP